MSPTKSGSSRSTASPRYTPRDHGRKMGLQGMINNLLETVDKPVSEDLADFTPEALRPDHKPAVARVITLMEQKKIAENGHLEQFRAELRRRAESSQMAVLGITGTGGSGKSSLTDELILRFLYDFPDKTVGILAVDPTRRKRRRRVARRPDPHERHQ